MTPEHLAHVLRPFLLAGWTAPDIVHALDYTPDSQPWPYAYQSADLRYPAGWIAFRLRAWRTPDGHPQPSPTQLRRPTPSPARPAPPPRTPPALAPQDRSGPSPEDLLVWRRQLAQGRAREQAYRAARSVVRAERAARTAAILAGPVDEQLRLPPETDRTSPAGGER